LGLRISDFAALPLYLRRSYASPGRSGYLACGYAAVFFETDATAAQPPKVKECDLTEKRSFSANRRA
jgi:hypothetical protein